MLTLAVFGNPVAHSKSPLMHNMALKNLNILGCYKRVLLEDGSQLKKRFLELKLDGANVTLPHKESAFLQADEVRGIAKNIGAVNTLVLEDDKLVGYNTDAEGFFLALKEFGNIKNALILGAGGSAKAIAEILFEKEISFCVLNRSKERLEHFKNKASKLFSWDECEIDAFDLIINTTSAGLNDTELPAPASILEALFKKAKFAIDIIYGKETPFLKLASSFKLKIKDGSEMLLNQGALAFEIFCRQRFSFEVIKAEMQKGLSLK